MMTTATTQQCSVCGKEINQERIDNHGKKHLSGVPGLSEYGHSEESCGQYHWFPDLRIDPVDLRINLGLVIQLLRDESCVVSQGEIIREDQYEDMEEYRQERREMLERLAEAEKAVYDAAATEILAILAEPNGAPPKDSCASANASKAICRRGFPLPTFADPVNWSGGIHGMFRALDMIKQHAALGIVPVESESRNMVEVACDQERKSGEHGHTAYWAQVVHRSHAMVDAAADACVAYQIARVEPAFDKLRREMGHAIGRVIGVDAEEE